jgi:dihydropyrimidinase
MSAQLDLVLSGGKVLIAGGDLVEADLGIAGGRIAAIAAPGALTSSEARQHIRGLVVLPGAIDAHVHLGHGDDITRPRVAADAESETAAAAAGGVTTFIAYLISDRRYLPGTLGEVLHLTRAGARIDFGFHLVISTEEQLAEVPRCAREHGIASFKLFMYSRGGEGKRLGLPDIDDGFLFRLLESAHEAGGIVCPHCENIEVGWVLRDRLMEADPDGAGGLELWNASRPPLLEAEAVHRAATLARLAGAPLYMVHCSSAAGLEAALAERRLGADITIETCPHYLTHTTDSHQKLKAKVNPPVRSADDVEALWKGLMDGSIEVVGSDHVHRDAKAKTDGAWKASPGFPGMETLLPVLISEGYHKRGLALSAIARLVSQNPARIMGLGSKGSIAVGKDADLAMLDLDRRWTADEGRMHSSAGFSIYDGWEFRGKVVHTMARGRFVLRDGMLCDDAIGFGQFVHRTRELTYCRP